MSGGSDTRLPSAGAYSERLPSRRLLHGFVKKDRKTRKQDLSLAQKRKRQIESAQV